MATHHPNYVSIFKIEGVPILPPLMTEEKRRQMQKYKEIAVQLQYSGMKQHNIDKHLLRHGHSHIPQSQTPRKHFIDTGTSMAVSKRAQINKLRQTDTLVYDNQANSIILTLEGFEEETEFQSVEIERPQNLDQNENKISPHVPKSPAKEESSDTPSKQQPYAAFIPIPSICVNPPTPCVSNKPICETTPPKRLCCSPALKPRIDSGLIRSNSFTLEGPSSALLEHIKNQKLKKSTATQDTIESKAKRVQKVEIAPKLKSSSTSLGQLTNNTTTFKAKRSPYDAKQSCKKVGRKHKFVKPATPKKSPMNNVELLSNLTSIPKSRSELDVLKDIEEHHRARFLELVRQQQVEQKRLQEQFETQQNLLLEQLSARMSKMQMQSPPSVSNESAHSSLSPSSEHESSSARVTPRRRLFPDKTTLPVSTAPRDPSPSSQGTNASRRLEQKNLHYWAATTINACARGFLTRRLFKTDYIQRIVQTIKDTLIFVLTLHVETSGDKSENNTKLKARLLQQLTSASQTLHSLFMKTTVKERMEIIARDRKYMQAKLLNVKRSPRIIG